MTKNQYRFVHFTSYLTIFHGILYWLVKEFFQVETDYGLRPHSSQTYIQAAHILLSPLLVISFGLLWQNHIILYFSKKTKKLKTGITLTLSLVILILSGYLIQVIYNDLGKVVVTWVHLILSLLYLLSYLIHHGISLKKK